MAAWRTLWTEQGECAQIAARSGEPFRLQCYTFLKSVAPSSGPCSGDFLGAALSFPLISGPGRLALVP